VRLGATSTAASVQDWLVATALNPAQPTAAEAQRVIDIARDIGGGAVVALVHALQLTEAEAQDALGAVGLLGVDPTAISCLARDGLPAPVPVAPKAFPTCGASHTAIETTLELRQHWPDPGDPEVVIEVTCPSRVMVALEFDRPSSSDEARFSLPYAVAVAWRHGLVAPQSFAPGALADPAVADLMDKVKITVDEALSPPSSFAPSSCGARPPCSGRSERQQRWQAFTTVTSSPVSASC
jgi:hypothetical protein